MTILAALLHLLNVKFTLLYALDQVGSTAAYRSPCFEYTFEIFRLHQKILNHLVS